MLDNKTREIAIQAIAARASGTPVEAAEQILEGISALDFPGRPFVVWPAKLNFSEQLEVLELELKRVRYAQQSMEGYWAVRESIPQADLDVCPEHQDAQSHSEASGVLGAAVENQPAPGEAAEEAALHSVPKPDQGASDASQ
ncbi:hypothetical protein [Pseudomonas protegens]|uniref:hypothetical protein n=1 Tax=Pseudomonas protegens TaxID=380021 RepID=UPI0027664137|nr:hypothetical protein [Pseudomonas protegens]MDP9528525.1 hypothetical protein [Pseudomonas protegens]